MKNLVLGVLWVVCLPVWGQTLTCKNAAITFFSSAPLEDIEGRSKAGGAALNRQTGDLVVKVRNTSFQFDKKLMREHFNENYMESEKYPVSEFRGKIQDPAVLAIRGKHTVEVSGTLQIHGVTKPYTVIVNLEVSDGGINAKTDFPVKVGDHGIRIPSVVGKNIAETVKVSIQALLVP